MLQPSGQTKEQCCRQRYWPHPWKVYLVSLVNFFSQQDWKCFLFVVSVTSELLLEVFGIWSWGRISRRWILIVWGKRGSDDHLIKWSLISSFPSSLRKIRRGDASFLFLKQIIWLLIAATLNIVENITIGHLLVSCASLDIVNPNTFCLPCSRQFCVCYSKLWFLFFSSQAFFINCSIQMYIWNQNNILFILLHIWNHSLYWMQKYWRKAVCFLSVSVLLEFAICSFLESQHRISHTQLTRCAGECH